MLNFFLCLVLASRPAKGWTGGLTLATFKLSPALVISPVHLVRLLLTKGSSWTFIAAQLPLGLLGSPLQQQLKRVGPQCQWVLVSLVLCFYPGSGFQHRWSRIAACAHVVARLHMRFGVLLGGLRHALRA